MDRLEHFSHQLHFGARHSREHITIKVDGKTEQQCLRDTSDRLCWEYGLSVIEHGRKAPSRPVWQNEQNSKTVQTQNELEMLCRKELPETSWPYAYCFVDYLPTTQAGKVDFRALEHTAANDFRMNE